MILSTLCSQPSVTNDGHYWTIQIYFVYYESGSSCKNTNNYIIINTLDTSMQQCLILNTTKIENEEALINSIIKKFMFKI